MTNIMKYAFIGREDGAIDVRLVKADNHITFTLTDNGCGLPAGFETGDSKGFGLMLVAMLAEQLGGSFSLASGNGTKSVLRFDL
jgi:two-component sensor histidine kinase